MTKTVVIFILISLISPFSSAFKIIESKIGKISFGTASIPLDRIQLYLKIEENGLTFSVLMSYFINSQKEKTASIYYSQNGEDLIHEYESSDIKTSLLIEAENQKFTELLENKSENPIDPHLKSRLFDLLKCVDINDDFIIEIDEIKHLHNYIKINGGSID